MSNTVTLTGENTIEFSPTSSTGWLRRYFPEAPEPRNGSQNADGQINDRADIVYDDVTDTLDVGFIGSTTAAMRANINTVQDLLEMAAYRRRQARGTRTYLTYSLEGETAYRTEILFGRLQHDRDSGDYWTQKLNSARLIVTRRPFWEGARTEIPLTSNATSKQTGGVVIDNYANNWVDIDAADIDGVIPAPIELEFKNGGSAVAITDLAIANNIFNDPGNFNPYIQGETAYVPNGGSTDIRGDGSTIQRYSWTGTTDTDAMIWALSDTFLNDAAGSTFRVFVRFNNTPSSSILMHMRVGPYVYPLFYPRDFTRERNTDRQLTDMGTLQIPPGIATTGIVDESVALALHVRAQATGTVDVDFVYLVPDEELRLVKQAQALTTSTNETLVDDQIERLLYSREAGGTNKYLFYRGEGQCRVWPGRDQRIRFLVGNTSSYPISQAWTVRAYYRPRRLTV